METLIVLLLAAILITLLRFWDRLFGIFRIAGIALGMIACGIIVLLFMIHLSESIGPLMAVVGFIGITAGVVIGLAFATIKSFREWLLEEWNK